MRIAIFDYTIVRNNAIGKCHLQILAELCREHEFTVFAVRFENPCPERIQWVRVPAPLRPQACLFLAFHFLAPICFLLSRLRHRARFDIVQVVESNVAFGDISYSHFCHREFLQCRWSQSGSRGLRGLLRWLDHWFRALSESWTYRKAHKIVVPSQGLARELAARYPFVGSKIQVLNNPVSVDDMDRPAAFDADRFRFQLGFSAQDIVLSFVALGHYERKGLPNLLDALRLCGHPDLKLVVVGGPPALISVYEKRVRSMHLERNVVFAGMKPDVRPYLWASDALILPSHYEVFPFAALEGAAAGLPLLATPLNGVEEFLRDGENGILMKTQDAAAISQSLLRFARLPVEARRALGSTARESVRRYSPALFTKAWSTVYKEAIRWANMPS